MMGFFSVVHLFSFILICSNYLCTISGNDDLKTYIVHVELPKNQLSVSLSQENDLESWYRSFLPTTTTGSTDGSEKLVYAYRNVFKGFAATLTSEQVKEMKKVPGFVSANPEEVYSLHTTRSTSFMGLDQNVGLWNVSGYGKGVIIGVLDTGVNPRHPSFSDVGMSPPPPKWKGKCLFNSTTSCNNKIIGAQIFTATDNLDTNTPVDGIGHGTHTASTAAGNFVEGANLFGNAYGTANGVAPHAHLAIYKVCSLQCYESALLAGMDEAISDGVDILSLSLGSTTKPFYSDNIAYGAFSAIQRGILVSCSAGNQGPKISSVTNEAPWILTVGASTIDRKITSTLKLGNNMEFNGESAFQPTKFVPNQIHLFYPGKNDPNSNSCALVGLNDKVKDINGKIVVCVLGTISPIEKGKNVKNAGGVGMILINQEQHGYTTFSDPHVLPATHLSYADGLKVLAYINSTTSPTASFIFKGTTVGDTLAPTVTYFSSRGPSMETPGILKPDIIGPGLNILAAWPSSVENITNATATFNIISGTSMACPHLSGVSALLKSLHPDWSPAAIKSAIITTADIVNRNNNATEDETLHPANDFTTGSGHVNPNKASNPGLIYDILPDDYIPYMCGLNYTINQIAKIVQKTVNCANATIPEAQLNYPSFSIIFGNKVQTYTRIVTNVGDADSSYTVNIVPPPNVDVKVTPKILKFSQINEKLKYDITFTLLPPTNQGNGAQNITSQGFISWNSEKYSVRSPIVVTIRA